MIIGQILNLREKIILIQTDRLLLRAGLCKVVQNSKEGCRDETQIKMNLKLHGTA